MSGNFDLPRSTYRLLKHTWIPLHRHVTIFIASETRGWLFTALTKGAFVACALEYEVESTDEGENRSTCKAFRAAALHIVPKAAAPSYNQKSLTANRTWCFFKTVYSTHRFVIKTFAVTCY